MPLAYVHAAAICARLGDSSALAGAWTSTDIYTVHVHDTDAHTHYTMLYRYR